MIPGYTESAKHALDLAEDTAKRFNGGYVGTEHILAGLFMSESTAKEILNKHGLDEDMTLEYNIQLAERGGKKAKTVSYSPKALDILEWAKAKAASLGSKKVGTEHILMALSIDTLCMAHRDLIELGIGTIALYIDAMMALGFSRAAAKKDFVASGGSTSSSKPFAGNQKKKNEFLEKFAKNLNKAAKEGQIDPCIGREKEIASVLQILSRRNKNNPCLIGEAGVGKTAIAEAIATKMVSGDVPDFLKGFNVYTLDLTGIVAGTKYRGEFEDRIKKVITEAAESGDVILFIDEIHTIIGAGGSEGALDASNILKPYLARGELQIIGATTTSEYRKHIEKDQALERRFQPVMVEEPAEDDCIKILKGLKHLYEEHHDVEITDDAVVAAVKYTKRYVNDRFLPDKAIDAMDEAASKIRTGFASGGEDIIKTEAKIRLLTTDFENALKESKFSKAGDIKKEIDALKEEIAAVNESRERMADNKKNMRVTEEEIAQVVSMWTKIPVANLKEDELKRLKKLEDILHKRVIGQDEAVSAVAKAVQRGRLGLKSPNRPVGSFLFLGPTGVGKTELSKALAEAVFGSENDIIRVDMSEYMEKHSVSKMVGSPPGYVGFEEGGQLSEKVRRKPYSVLLFDEIEKAHPDVFNILLQVLEDGHITDSQGRRVSFKDTIIIMTSNAGASKIVAPKLLGFSSQADEEADYQKMKSGVLEEVKKIFKPEFINRIDEMLVFHSLTKENIEDITKLMLKELRDRTVEQMDIELSFKKSIITHISENGFDKDYGARPIRRAIRKDIEDGLAAEILSGNIKRGSKVKVSYSKETVVFEECE